MPTQNQLPETALDQLNRAVLPEIAATRPGDDGNRIAFLPGHTVITQANRIFGHGGWSFTHEEPQPVYDRSEPPRLIAYRCKGELRIGDTVYQDVGFNAVSYPHDQPNQLTADNIEMAYKGCVTDATTRCFRHLGDQFGNSLYEKADQRRRLFERVSAITRRGTELLKGYDNPELVPVSLMLKALQDTMSGAGRRQQDETAGGGD